MPIRTTLLMTRSPPRVAPSTLLAHQSWPTISAVVRFRLKPCRPVEQNRQAIVQPAWVETHRVPRFASGMNTVSTALRLPTSSSHFRVPSAATLSAIIGGGWTSATPASLSRASFARSVMRVKSDSPNWCTQRMSCRARNGFSPRSAQKAPSAAASSPSRLTFIPWIGARAPLRSLGSSRGVVLMRVDLAARKEECDLGARRVRSIGAVDRVRVDRCGEVGADRALRRLLRIGRAHQLAVLRDRTLALEHLHHDRPGRHELDE